VPNENYAADDHAASALADLLARVESVRPVLAANAGQGSSDRRVPSESIAALTGAGAFKVMVPRRYGGYELGVRALLDVSAAVAAGDGSAGWVTSLTGVCAWMVGLYSGKAQDEVFGADPDARVCGSGSPIGTGVQVEGGWRVSGRWPYISGSLHAGWATLGFLGSDRSGRPAGPAMALVPMVECTLEDTWHTAGMRATGSNTLVAQDVFVPDHRVLSVSLAVESRYASEYGGESVYRAAFLPTATLVLVGPLLGLGRAALEYVREAAGRKGIVATTFAHQADSGGFQMQLAEAGMTIDTAHLHAHRAAADIEDHAARGTHPDQLARARIRADTAWAAEHVVAALTLLLDAHGSGGFAESSPLHRMWLDANVGARHALINPAVSKEIYGRALLGVDIDIVPAF
jgi:alkylation response protein AidB-like acyl-CoA dehydrogenase